MDFKPTTENLTNPAEAAGRPSRDIVRGWIVHEQNRIRRGTKRIGWLTLVAFVSSAAILLAMLDQQATQVRRMVKKNPSRSMIFLREVTFELGDEPPAEYFVRQLNQGKLTRVSGT